MCVYLRNGFLAVILIAQTSTATVVHYRTFDEMIEEAQVVARVLIESRRLAEYTYEGEKRTCGHIYNGQVRESLKGPPEPVEFFAATGFPYQPEAREYLIVASRSQPAQAKQLLADSEIEAQLYAHIMCTLSAPLFVNNTQQMWFPFVPEDTSRPPGEWLETRGRGLLSDRGRFQPRVRLSTGEHPSELVSWPAVRAEIRRKLDARAA